MQRQTLLGKFIIWRVKHIGDRQFIIFLSIIIGLAGGLAAVIIKNSVHLIQLLLTQGFIKEYHNYLYFAYPAIGIFITVIFIKYINRQHVGHGIPGVLYAISKNNGIIKRHNMFSSIITSALTVGFGGSVGLEGPTVATGAAVGSNVGRLLHLNNKQIILLLGCASAGAMAAIFKAPIAAIVFALEVIMLDLTMASLVPLLVASATATLTSYALLGQNVLYSFELKEQFIMSEIPVYILFGVLAGFVSVYYTRIYMFIIEAFDRIKNWYKRLLIGGLVLGVLIFLFPSLYGEGYEAINSCLHGNYEHLFNNSLFYAYNDKIIAIIILFFAIVIFKVIATAVTFGSGGVGGIFAPTLFMGANTGLLFATIFNRFNIKAISESNFALVGMAGLIAGVLHAPLTAIFLIAEITNGYALFMPLIITATISYATVRLFESNSVYTIQLAKRGELITHHKDKAVLSMMKVDKLIEKDFKTINPDATLRELVDVISKSTRNIYPVVGKDGILLGIVLLDHIRHIIFKPEMYDSTFARDLMITPAVSVDAEESMEDVAKKFQSSGNFNLPVLKDGKYLGFISRANVFSSYRRRLKQFSED